MSKSLLFLVLTFFGLTLSSQINYEEIYSSDKSYEEKDSILMQQFNLLNSDSSDSLRFSLETCLGRLNQDYGFFDEAETFLLKAKKSPFLKSKQSREVKVLNLLGEVYLALGKFDQSLKTYLKSVEIAEETKDVRTQIYAYNGIAELYRHYDYQTLSLNFNRKAVEKALLSKDEDLIARSYNNLSAVLGEIDSNKTAIDTLKSGLSYLSQSNYYGKGKLNSNLGFCYRNMGDFENALKHHKLALKFKLKSGAENSYGYSLDAIGRTFLSLGNTDSALYYVKQGLELRKKYNNPHYIKDSYSHLADVYEEIEDYQQALKFYRISKYMEDSIYDIETEQKMLLYQRKYNLSQKEQEVLRLKNEKRAQESVEKRNVIIAIVLVSLSIFLAILFRLSAKRKEAEKKAVELLLKNAEAEKERNRQELNTFTKDLMGKNKAIMGLNEKLQEKELEIQRLRNAKSEDKKELVDIKILTDEDWTKFKSLFEKVYPLFFERLNASEFSFTKGEKRLMALLRLNMQNNEIADTLGISSESVSKSKFRLKKKLEAKGVSSAEDFVFQF